ncbi:MAG: serine/threonine-protein kinase [Polyangiaceae bacterium]
MRYCERCKAAFQSRSTCPKDRVPTRADLADPLLGEVIGDRYRVLDRVAAGGMGQVYRAAHARIASLFAVKVLYGDLAFDPGMRARFQREAEATSLLSHRHIVRVLDFGETPAGLLYLTMEYVDGSSLSGVLAREGRLSEGRAVMFARQVARGLAHAHERGIVHRDLKTDNVLVVREDEDEEVAKILDFGLAQIRTEQRLTQAGQVFGTPQYMAPEQFFRADVDARADLYSLGVMMQELLTGAIPFDAPTLADMARLHAQAPPPSLRASAPHVSAQLEAIVSRLLAKSPDDRFPSARALLDALRPLAGVAPAAPAPVSVPVSKPPERAIPPAVCGPIEAAILRGAPAYNAGDYAGCAALYAQAAKQLVDYELAQGPVAGRARVRAALARAARATTPSDAAWEMRYALDDLYAATQAPRPADTPAGWVATEIALAEVIGGPRYAAGHVDLIGDYYLALVEEIASTLRGGDPQSAAAEYLDRVARSAASRGGGQRSLAFLHESLSALGRGMDTTLASAQSLGDVSVPTFSACPALEAVAARIVQALQYGVPAYNAGDPTTCARVYRQAAEQIIAEIAVGPACAPVAQRLRAAVQEATPRDADGAAWALRRAFDELLAASSRRDAR